MVSDQDFILQRYLQELETVYEGSTVAGMNDHTPSRSGIDDHYNVSPPLESATPNPAQASAQPPIGSNSVALQQTASSLARRAVLTPTSSAGQTTPIPTNPSPRTQSTGFMNRIFTRNSRMTSLNRWSNPLNPIIISSQIIAGKYFAPRFFVCHNDDFAFVCESHGTRDLMARYSTVILGNPTVY